MTTQELFIRTNQELKHIFDQINDEQWGLQLPEGASRKPATLQQAVAYHAYDDAWVSDVLAGKTAAEVGNAYEGILATEEAHLLETYARYNSLACTAVAEFSELDKIVHLSYGDFPAHDYLQHITSYRAFRIFDIGKLIGANTTMAADFVQALWDEFSPVVEGYRAMGVFPAAIAVPPEADLQTKLLGLAGRTA